MSAARPSGASEPPVRPDPDAGVPAAIRRAAKQAPERGITLVDNRGRPSDRRDYGELPPAFDDAAARLAAAGVSPGDRVMICLPTGWDWIDHWFGALWMGALPVAIAPPGAMGSPSGQIEKALRVGRQIGARALIGNELLLREAAVLGAADEELTGTPLMDVEELRRVTAGGPPPSYAPRDTAETAFLQLTSGSTGLPRAVQMSHGNVLHNAGAIIDRLTEPYGTLYDRVVSWLPLYHDMGLVGVLITHIVHGIDIELLTPRTFLARPHLWLERVAGDVPTMSVGPNFAFQMCVDRLRPRQLEGLDLANWQHAVTGSEMVRPETMSAFAERFAAAGFAAEALRPSFGLAEAALAVTMVNEAVEPVVRNVPSVSGADTTIDAGSELDTVVSTGPPLRDLEVRIADQSGRALDAETIGRVLIRGPSVMTGYYRDEQATRDSVVGNWLDTGDLGFLDPAGALYLTGRRKEILILNGQNVMPHEIEWLAENVIGGGGALRTGAFSVLTEAGEAPVVVAETVDRDAEAQEQIAHEIRSAVGLRLGLPLEEVVLVRRGSIPRTSSGKVQRMQLKRLYLEGDLQAVGAE